MVWENVRRRLCSGEISRGGVIILRRGYFSTEMSGKCQSELDACADLSVELQISSSCIAAMNSRLDLPRLTDRQTDNI